MNEREVRELAYGHRGEIVPGSGRAVAPQTLSTSVVSANTIHWWRCEPCGLAWPHARPLATHMMKIHGEPHWPTGGDA